MIGYSGSFPANISLTGKSIDTDSVMLRYPFYFLLLMGVCGLMLSCKKNPQKEIAKVVAEWQSKEVVFPAGLVFTKHGRIRWNMNFRTHLTKYWCMWTPSVAQAVNCSCISGKNL